MPCRETNCGPSVRARRKSSLKRAFASRAGQISGLIAPGPGPLRDEAAINRGRKLFFSGEVGCAGCHPAPLYTDNRLHDAGTHGRHDVTTDAEGKRVPQTAFKTPSLLEAWRTAPYLHGGRHGTVREVITGGNRSDRRDHTSHLTSGQADDLTAFVESL